MGTLLNINPVPLAGEKLKGVKAMAISDFSWFMLGVLACMTIQLSYRIIIGAIALRERRKALRRLEEDVKRTR